MQTGVLTQGCFFGIVQQAHLPSNYNSLNKIMRIFIVIFARGFRYRSSCRIGMDLHKLAAEDEGYDGHEFDEDIEGGS